MPEAKIVETGTLPSLSLLKMILFVVFGYSTTPLRLHPCDYTPVTTPCDYTPCDCSPATTPVRLHPCDYTPMTTPLTCSFSCFDEENPVCPIGTSGFNWFHCLPSTFYRLLYRCKYLCYHGSSSSCFFHPRTQEVHRGGNSQHNG